MIQKLYTALPFQGHCYSNRTCGEYSRTLQEIQYQAAKTGGSAVDIMQEQSCTVLMQTAFELFITILWKTAFRKNLQYGKYAVCHEVVASFMGNLLYVFFSASRVFLSALRLETQ